MTPRQPEHARRTRPCVRAALLIAAGIIIANNIPDTAIPNPLWIYLAAAAFASIGLLSRPRITTPALALAAVLFGGALDAARVRTVPSDSILHHLTAAPAPIVVRGTIASAPELTRSQRGSLARFARYDPAATRFTLRCTHLIAPGGDKTPVTGRLLVRITGDATHLRSGDALTITGLASRIPTPGNPGAFNAQHWYAQQDIRGRISLATPDLAQRETDAPRLSADRWIDALRARAGAWLADTSPDRAETRALLAALLLGLRDHDIGQTGPAFQRLGIAHILAISGLHLALVAGALLLIIRLTGDRPRLECIIIALTIAAAIILIPARSPILRAALMLGAFLAAETAGRRYDRLNTLALVAIAILIWRPLELFSPGFQLSFGAVAALLAVAPVLRDRLFGQRDLHAEDHLAKWSAQAAKTSIAASLTAWAITTPLAAYHFGIFTPLGAPATLILSIPVAITLVVGYASMILAALVPALDAPLHAALFALGDLLRAIVLTLDASAWSVVSLPRLSIPWTIAATALIVWWCVRGTHRDPRTLIATAIVALWTTLSLTAPSLPADTRLRIDALDVGDGSCYLIRAGDEAIAFDCGSTWFGMGETSIPQAVRAAEHRAPPVRTVIVSHADTDHYSALLDAAGPLGVRRILTTPQFLRAAESEPDGPAAFFLRELADRHITVSTISAGDSLTLSDSTLEVLWPPADASFDKDNDASLVILIHTPTDAGERSFLLTGDIERRAIDALTPKLRETRIDAMEAPHHGSARDFAADFITALDPPVVIQSTGHSRLDDPRWDAVRAGRTWLVTARDGAATVEIRRTSELKTSTFRRSAGQ